MDTQVKSLLSQPQLNGLTIIRGCNYKMSFPKYCISVESFMAIQLPGRALHCPHVGYGWTSKLDEIADAKTANCWAEQLNNSHFYACPSPTCDIEHHFHILVMHVHILAFPCTVTFRNDFVMLTLVYR